MLETNEYSFDVDAKQQGVWAFFWDVDALARCIPGCQSVKCLDPQREYLAEVRRHMGPFLIRMELTVQIVRAEEPRLIGLVVSGRDKRLRSEARQQATLTFEQTDNDQTHVIIRTSLELTGLLATLGKHLVKTQIDQSLNEFVAALRAALTAHTQATTRS